MNVPQLRAKFAVEWLGRGANLLIQHADAAPLTGKRHMLHAYRGIPAERPPVGGLPLGIVKEKQAHEIPFRCLQPVGIGNLLVACRAISTDHFAHAATRVMGTMTSVCEAAGLAGCGAGPQGRKNDGADRRRRDAGADRLSRRAA
jgi:hypothetical protein